MAAKPLIGINTDYRSARKEHAALSFVAAGYYDGILASGGIPVILPPLSEEDDIVRVLDMLDATVTGMGAWANGVRTVAPSVESRASIRGSDGDPASVRSNAAAPSSTSVGSMSDAKASGRPATDKAPRTRAVAISPSAAIRPRAPSMRKSETAVRAASRSTLAGPTSAKARSANRPSKRVRSTRIRSADRRTVAEAAS
jgi:hypothetical protein